MAVKRGGESRAGLVVFLVLFILISIGLGVTTYYGYEEANTQKKAAEEKVKETKTMTTNKDYWKFLALTYRAYLGIQPETKDDPKILAELRNQYVNNKDIATAADDSKEVHRKTITADWSDQSEMKWEVGTGKPAKTYDDVIKKLREDMGKKDEALKAADKKAMDLEAELKAKISELKAAQASFEANLANHDKVNDDKLAQVTAEKNKIQQAFEEWSKKPLTDLDNQKKELVAANKENAELKRQLDESRKTAKKVQDELAAVRSVAEEIDITKVAPENLATITSVNRGGDMPYIGLGSADGLRRQVTFSIFGKGVDGRPLKEPKGKLEVIRITGEHSAQAQITELRDERRDPVLPGDFIYNPAWNPNLKQHVVLVGIIDLTGEGRDNTQELIRNLKNQNVEVDAYMDLKPPHKLKSVNGGGEAEITRGTDMVIVGSSPDLGTAPVRGADDKGDSRKAMIDAMDKIQHRADQLGVRVIRLRNFLETSGYVLPKSPAANAGKVGFQRNLDAAGSPVKPNEPKK